MNAQSRYKFILWHSYLEISDITSTHGERYGCEKRIFMKQYDIGDGSKFIGYPGGTIDRGAKTFFRKKIGGRRLFFEKN